MTNRVFNESRTIGVFGVKKCPVCGVGHKFKEGSHRCIQTLWIKFYGEAPEKRKPMTVDEKSLMMKMEAFHNSLPNSGR